MDTHHTFADAVDASVSVPSPTAAFAFTHNAPSPESPGEFGMHQHTQRPHSHPHPHPHPYSHSHTNAYGTHPEASPVGASPDFDFDFANSLRAVRGARSSSSLSSSSYGHGQGSHQGQGSGQGAGAGDGGRGRGHEGMQGPTASEAAVAETIVRARKSWKTVKGRSEPVWPPLLEKALVQALLQYKPHDSRYARALGRFPKRNRYISDFIFAATGVRRSPKQVGSRLQQLKDVSCGKMLLNHVASWSLEPPSTSSTSSSLANDAPISPSNLHPDLNVIVTDVHGHGSEGSQSPVSPLAGARGSSAAALKTYNAHSALYPASRVQARGYASAPSSPFDSPPLTPMVRTLDVFVPFDPAGGDSASASSRAGAAGDESPGRPLVHFGGCLARPETVFAPEPAPGWMEPCATFTARDPIAAQSVARVWAEGASVSSSSSSSSPISPSSLLPSSAQMGRERPGGRVQVHEHSQPLVCTQTPAARVSAAQSPFYSVDKIALGRGPGQGQESGNGQDRECFMYATRLVDDAMWRAMRREGAGLSRYTISQELMYSFDSPGTARGETFLAITYHFVPISPFAAHSPLSPLSTHGAAYAYGYGYGRGSMSPTSSGSPSPINASPASFMHPQLHAHGFPGSQQAGRMQGHEQEMYGTHAHAYAHAQTRVPQLSVHPPAPSISQTGGLTNVYGQEGYYDVNGNPTLNTGPFPEYNVDFNALDMDNLHLSASMGLDRPLL